MNRTMNRPGFRGSHWVSEYIYEDGEMFVCPECAHEWPQAIAVAEESSDALVVKVGTKVKDIRLIEGDHEIDYKIDGIGSMQLKSEFVKRG